MCDEFCVVGEHSKCVEGLCCKRTISQGVYGRFSVGAGLSRKVCGRFCVIEEDSFKGVCGRF